MAWVWGLAAGDLLLAGSSEMKLVQSWHVAFEGPLSTNPLYQRPQCPHAIFQIVMPSIDIGLIPRLPAR